MQATEVDMQRSLMVENEQRALFVKGGLDESTNLSSSLPPKFVIEGLEVDEEAVLSSGQTPQNDRDQMADHAMKDERRAADTRIVRKESPEAKVNIPPKLHDRASDVQQLHANFASVVRDARGSLNLLISSQDRTDQTGNSPLPPPILSPLRPPSGLPSRPAVLSPAPAPSPDLSTRLFAPGSFPSPVRAPSPATPVPSPLRHRDPSLQGRTFDFYEAFEDRARPIESRPPGSLVWV